MQRSDSSALSALNVVPNAWLFSPTVDLLAFVGSAALSVLLLVLGMQFGWVDQETPEWAWISCILVVDVAHVWSTVFRAYVEPSEWQRRPALLIGVPIGAAVIAYSLHAENPMWFWRALAYLAVWHFVRQQYGWVAWYRRRSREPWGWRGWVDGAAIYAATVVPLIHWHTQLPRSFEWFVEGDFLQPTEGQFTRTIGIAAWSVYGVVMVGYVIKAITETIRGRPQLGKDSVVFTTALCWYLGIVAFDSDYAFTVTNVLIHGVPYFVLIIAYRLGALSQPDSSSAKSPELATDLKPRSKRNAWKVLLLVLTTAWALAYFEELLWDRWVWHERPWLFGAGEDSGDWTEHWVGLLAVPQITHYVLDGFLWRRRDGIAQANGQDHGL